MNGRYIIGDFFNGLFSCFFRYKKQQIFCHMVVFFQREDYHLVFYFSSKIHGFDYIGLKKKIQNQWVCGLFLRAKQVISW